MVSMNTPTKWIAFDGTQKIINGEPEQVADFVQKYTNANPQSNILAFDEATSQQLDMDGPGSLLSALRRLPLEKPVMETPVANIVRSVGRPKLGVTPREVTLLPRHWEWLASQPGGASVALRKLVEQAQRTNKDIDRMRGARDAAYRFMNAMAGNYPDFEEATRALFAGNLSLLQTYIENWPQDIRNHTLSLAQASIESEVDKS